MNQPLPKPTPLAAASDPEDVRRDRPRQRRSAGDGAAPEPQGRGRPRLASLPPWLRIALLGIGLALVVIGIAGLVLPGLQGVFTILLGLAVLSLVSRSTHRFLRWTLGPWPRLRKRVERQRRRFHRWLHRNVARDGGESGEGDAGSASSPPTDPGADRVDD